MCRVHSALKELQAITMMFHRMAFQLSGKVVALQLHNSTIKNLFDQGSIVSLFPSRFACHILDLTSKHSITLLPVYIPSYLNVETNYLTCWLRLVT